MSRRTPDHIYLAGCEWALEDTDRLRAIARACGVEVAAVTGPAVDAAAALMARGQDPDREIGWIVDACRRELRPRGPLMDPAVAAEQAAVTPMVYSGGTLRARAYHDAHVTARTGRRHAARLRAAVQAGQMRFPFQAPGQGVRS